MKSKDIKKTVSAKKASLGRVLKKNEKIKQTVKNAASELTLVNEVLKQEKVPVQIMKQALTQNESVLSIIASIGIALYPADGDTSDILFKNADTAMYKAKGTEKRVVLFRESGEQKAG